MSLFQKLKKAFKRSSQDLEDKFDDLTDKSHDRDDHDRVRDRERHYDGDTHTVVRGDTLSGIALKHYGDASKYPRIYAANRDLLTDPDKIYPGQVLRLPELDDD